MNWNILLVIALASLLLLAGCVSLKEEEKTGFQEFHEISAKISSFNGLKDYSLFNKTSLESGESKIDFDIKVIKNAENYKIMLSSSQGKEDYYLFNEKAYFCVEEKCTESEKQEDIKKVQELIAKNTVSAEALLEKDFEEIFPEAKDIALNEVFAVIKGGIEKINDRECQKFIAMLSTKELKEKTGKETNISKANFEYCVDLEYGFVLSAKLNGKSKILDEWQETIITSETEFKKESTAEEVTPKI